MYIENIANNVKNIRMNLKMNISEVSRISGVNPRTIRNFENKKNNISLKKLCELVSTYDIDLDFKRVAKIVGKNIRKVRLSKGYTIDELADIMSASHVSIVNYENAKGNISLQFITRLSEALEIEPELIYAFDELDTAYKDISSYYNAYTGKILDEKDFISLNELKLYYVIDGDTLKTNVSRDGRVRLLGIDTPESIKKSQMWGLLAKDYTKYLLSMADHILIEYENSTNKTDDYGRHLGWVWILINNEYQLLNYILVQSGFADNKYLDIKSKYYDLMLRAENEAKEHNRVMWGYKYLDPYWDYINNKHKYKFYVIQVDNKYLKLDDYDLNNFELSSEYTKIRFIEEARYVRKLIVLKYDSSHINIVTRYE